MSLAQLFFMKETFRARVRKWLQACFRYRSTSYDCSDASRITHHASHLTSPSSRFTLEALEPRLLLDASPLLVNMEALGHELTVQVQNDGVTSILQVLDTATATVVASQNLADTSEINFVGSDANDALTIDQTADMSGLSITFAGGLGDDTVFGPAVNTTWYITGESAGHIGAVNFAGIENLTGAADNQDTFVLQVGGSLAGLIDGAAGGFDSLEIAGGSYQTVRYSATGPNSGQIDLDGTLVNYAGLEPITDNLDAINRVFTATEFADNIVLKNGLLPGFLTISSDNGSFESHTFLNPIGSLTIDAAGADDRISITALPNYAGSITIQGGADDDTLIVRSPTAVVTLNDTQVQIGSNAFAHQTVEEVIVYSPSLNDTSTALGVIHVAGIPEWIEQGPAPIFAGAGLVPTPITGTAQGGTANTIRLAATASTQDDFYNNMVVRLMGGTGRIGQTFTITNYVGDTRVATIAGAWTTNPTADTTYQIYSNQVAGAVSAVAAHPSDANIIFIGTVGGGIWRAKNAVIGLDKVDNDTDGFIDTNDPSEAFRWMPLTDQFPSLSISAITFDPVNPQIMYAGTGKVSSSRLSGKGVGLLKTFDGGDTWRLINHPDFQELTVHKIVVLSGDVVLVALQAKEVGTSEEKGGLYRSTDGGAHFTKISGNGADQKDNNNSGTVDEFAEFTGLPGGSVTDLWVDPTNNQIIYAGSSGNGVYKSINGGQTWNAINSGLPETILPSSTTSVTAQGGSANTIILPANATAIDDFVVDVYVQITGGTGTVGERFIITDYDGTTKTATIAGNWTTIPDATTTFQLARLTPVRVELAVSPVDLGGGVNPIYAALISNNISSTTTAVSAANQVTINSTPTNTLLLSLFEAGDTVTISDSARTIPVGQPNAGQPISENLTIARVTVNGATTTLRFTANITNGPYTAGSTVTYGKDRLTGLYRSVNEGVNWTPMALPNSTDTTEFDANNNNSIDRNANEIFLQTYGIHPAGQGDIHFSMVADPTNPNLIYIGGDRQPVAGSFDWSGDGDVSDPVPDVAGIN